MKDTNLELREEQRLRQQRREKRFKLLIILLIIVGLGFFVKGRWRAWFVNQPEKEYHTEDVIDRITIVSGEDFTTTRQISWRCGETIKESKLYYASVSNGEASFRSIPAKGTVVTSRKGKGCYYTATLPKLQAGGHYLYYVQTGKLVSPTYPFEIPKELDKSTRFVYLGDVQDPTGELSAEMFPKLKALGKKDIHFIATAGDQIEGPTNKYWDIWYKSWGEDYIAQMPFIVATGNHEYLKRGLLRELDPRWVVQYNYPQNGPNNFWGRSYYIDFPLMRFIVLDSNGISLPSDILNHRSWLKKTLLSSTQKWQVVMFHHGIKSVREGRSNPIMTMSFKGLLEEYGADLILQGHDHAYSRITTKNDKKECITPVYVISTSSPKIYRNEFDCIHDKLASGLQLYQIIDVTKKKIQYRAYQYDSSLYDALTIDGEKKVNKRYRVQDEGQEIPELFLFNNFAKDEKGLKKAEDYKTEVLRRNVMRLDKLSQSK